MQVKATFRNKFDFESKKAWRIAKFTGRAIFKRNYSNFGMSWMSISIACLNLVAATIMFISMKGLSWQLFFVLLNLGLAGLNIKLVLNGTERSKEYREHIQINTDPLASQYIVILHRTEPELGELIAMAMAADDFFIIRPRDEQLEAIKAMRKVYKVYINDIDGVNKCKFDHYLGYLTEK